MTDSNVNPSRECYITKIKVIPGNETHKYYLCVYLSTRNNKTYKIDIANLFVGDKDEGQFLHFQGGSTGICTILGGDNKKKEYNVDLVINESVLAILQKTKKIRISIGIHGEKMDDYIFPVSIEL